MQFLSEYIILGIIEPLGDLFEFNLSLNKHKKVYKGKQGGTNHHYLQPLNFGNKKIILMTNYSEITILKRNNYQIEKVFKLDSGLQSIITKKRDKFLIISQLEIYFFSKGFLKEIQFHEPFWV